MSSKIILSLLTFGVINSYGADDLSSMFTDGKVSGQIREFSIIRTYSYSDVAKDDFTRKANAIGGHLKYETADFKALSLGAAFYTTNGFLLQSPKDDYRDVDPTLLGKDNDSYTMLGEAYLKFKYENTSFKGGRQKIDTPLAGSDDTRMIPNLFEAYLLSNSDIDGLNLTLGHITKFAQGTFGRVYNGGILSATSGYSLVDSRNQVGDFENMGTYAVGESTAGVSVVSGTYSGIKNLKVQLWDYYAYDILNAVYAQADFSWSCLLSSEIKPFVSAQAIKEDEVGKRYLGELSGFYWAGKIGAKIENFKAYIAYSQTTSNSATNSAAKNAIITPWGGSPTFTQGMVIRHSTLAGTKATKTLASYNFKRFGADLSTTLYHIDFDMAANNGYTFADASENGFDIIYYPSLVDNLQIRFRGNFPRDFHVTQATQENTSWDEYRFIVNYNF
ncbi:MAG: OprD family outer membrane porin [Campylobacterota bacterium]|nr:OprD family outer membrane porin [Campylobacterota bacterium]